MIVTSPTGVERDLSIQVDVVIAYEQEHKGWRLIDMMIGFEDGFNFSDMDLIARILGFSGLAEAVNEGFSFEDLANAVSDSPLWGFTGSGKGASEN